MCTRRGFYMFQSTAVRGDLRELYNMDLKGRTYAYTPFCDSNTEMEGYRFWKQVAPLSRWPSLVLSFARGVLGLSPVCQGQSMWPLLVGVGVGCSYGALHVGVASVPL